MTAHIVQGDALHIPLPDESADLIVTSPPYFALRSYQDDGAHYAGQIGSEETPQLFLEALWAATEEMVRVLKPSGSIFVNLGDKYAGSGGHNNSSLAPPRTGEFATRKHNTEAPRLRASRVGGGGAERRAAQREASRRNAPDAYNKATIGEARPKSLMLLPERYRIGCVDRLGLIAREVLVWNKPNGLPESVRDRARRSHEDWVHLVKSPRYFSAVDEIREPHTGHTGADFKEAQSSNSGLNHRALARDESLFNPLGKLPGSVWSIPSEPLLIPEWARTKYDLPDHFAAFPQEWPRRLILGWSASGICVACGEGRRPVVQKTASGEPRLDHGMGKRHTAEGLASFSGQRPNADGDDRVTPWATDVSATITGYACACTPYTDHPERRAGQFVADRENDQDKGRRVPSDRKNTVAPSTRDYHLDGWTPPDTRPAVVLDPFGGTGTVALVADALGREGISIDLSHDYGRLAEWRCKESGHGRKALQKTWGERQQTMLGAAT